MTARTAPADHFPVEVRSGARLHFGLMCTEPDSPWRFGGIGAMIDHPGWRIRLRHRHNPETPVDALAGPTAVVNRVFRILNRFRRGAELGPICMVVDQFTPFHSGLGSGTQLTLAVGVALQLLTGKARPAAATDLAQPLGRMRRSGIGTFGFDRGGFIVDRGRTGDQRESLLRMPFPEEWSFVILRPTFLQGLHGAAEESFFHEPRYLSRSHVDALERLIEQEVCPSLQDAEFCRFATALSEYGAIIGSYFADAQGGVFSCPLFSRLVDELNAQGFIGAAQSSWGPSIAVPVAKKGAADMVVDIVRRFDRHGEINVSVTNVMSTGATVISPDRLDYRTFG